MRESYIEKAVCDYAKSKGWLVFKFLGRRGVPDRIFIRNGTCFYIEFKAPGKEPTELQKRMHNKIKAENFNVFNQVAGIEVKAPLAII